MRYNSGMKEHFLAIVVAVAVSLPAMSAPAEGSLSRTLKVESSVCGASPGEMARVYETARTPHKVGVVIDRAVLSVRGRVADPVLVEMTTGRVFEIPAESVRADGGETVLSDMQMWDSPVAIAERAACQVRDEVVEEGL